MDDSTLRGSGDEDGASRTQSVANDDDWSARRKALLSRLESLKGEIGSGVPDDSPSISFSTITDSINEISPASRRPPAPTAGAGEAAAMSAPHRSRASEPAVVETPQTTVAKMLSESRLRQASVPKHESNERASTKPAGSLEDLEKLKELSTDDFLEVLRQRAKSRQTKPASIPTPAPNDQDTEPVGGTPRTAQFAPSAPTAADAARDFQSRSFAAPAIDLEAAKAPEFPAQAPLSAAQDINLAPPASDAPDTPTSDVPVLNSEADDRTDGTPDVSILLRSLARLLEAKAERSTASGPDAASNQTPPIQDPELSLPPTLSPEIFDTEEQEMDLPDSSSLPASLEDLASSALLSSAPVEEIYHVEDPATRIDPKEPPVLEEIAFPEAFEANQPQSSPPSIFVSADESKESGGQDTELISPYPLATQEPVTTSHMPPDLNEGSQFTTDASIAPSIDPAGPIDSSPGSASDDSIPRWDEIPVPTEAPVPRWVQVSADATTANTGQSALSGRRGMSAPIWESLPSEAISPGADDGASGGDLPSRATRRQRGRKHTTKSTMDPANPQDTLDGSSMSDLGYDGLPSTITETSEKPATNKTKSKREKKAKKTKKQKGASQQSASGHSRWWLWLLLIVVAIVAGFALAYFTLRGSNDISEAFISFDYPMHSMASRLL